MKYDLIKSKLEMWKAYLTGGKVLKNHTDEKQNTLPSLSFPHLHIICQSSFSSVRSKVTSCYFLFAEGEKKKQQLSAIE